jgi:uncharacterized protein DUF2267
MREDEFLAEVQARGGLGSPEEAERAVRATLAVLGSRLPSALLRPLAQLLPGRLGDALNTVVPGQDVPGQVVPGQDVDHGLAGPPGPVQDGVEPWAAADTAARIDHAEEQARCEWA